MSVGLFLVAQSLVAAAPGLPQPIGPTGWSCDLAAADGSRVRLQGVTPAFEAGFDPNGSKPMEVTGSGLGALTGRASVSPGDAGEWFREFQVSGQSGSETYRLNLMLRREGSSVAYSTRYVSGRNIPYEYHAAGLCTADFAGRQPTGIAQR
jgi:hypothetical protein